MKGFSVAVINGLEEDKFQEELDKMIALITPAAKLEACYLVGTINGWNIDKFEDARKFTSEDGKIWTLEYTFETVDKTAVKAIQLKSDGKVTWSKADDLPITEAGTYVLTYDLDADKLTAVKK